jgi:hypothetical protein
MDRLAALHQFQPTFGWPNVFSPEDSGLALEDAWPSLYIGAERVGEMQRKTQQFAWARHALERWRSEAELVLQEKPSFQRGPTEGRCRLRRSAHGSHLLFDPSRCQPTYDPLTGEQVTLSEPEQRAWRLLCHERLRRLMSAMGLLYRLTGDERYSQWVWEGLRSAVELYGDPANRSEDTRYSYVYGGLYEAQAQLQHVQALELVSGAPGGSEADVSSVQKTILEPTGEALSRWMDVMLVHNMSCWAMAALAILGKHLSRADWIEKALKSERAGLRLLLEQGLPRDKKTGKPDGFWQETSAFYNFYAGTPLIALYRIGDEHGAINADLRERFQSFFDAPLHLADEKLRLLSIGDRVGPGQLSLTQMRHVYEYAAGQVDLKRFGPVLALLYERCGAARNSLSAVAWGPDELPPACQAPHASVVLGAARMAVFRKETSRGRTALWFLGGEDNHGGQGHHHSDKLSFSIVSAGEIVTMDLGLPGGSLDQTWEHFLNGTLSHNTLLVDESDQGPMESLCFEADVTASVPWVHSAVRGSRKGKQESIGKTMARISERVKPGVYDGVTLERTLFFDDPYVVLSDRGESADAKRFGFAFHACGTLVARGLAADGAALALPPLPDDGYYALFTHRNRMDPLQLLVADWRLRDGRWLRLIASADGPFEATWGRTASNPKTETRGTVLLRTAGKTRRFAAALEIHLGTPTLRSVAPADKEGAQVELYDGTRRAYSRK